MVNLKDLEERIEERKQQAEERQIAKKATTVAQKVGVKDLYNNGRDQHGIIYTFFGVPVLISHDDYCPDYEGGAIPTVKVSHEGKLVYHKCANTIESYIPSPWEQQLNRLYEQVLSPSNIFSKEKTEERYRMAEEYRERLREKAAKFGL